MAALNYSKSSGSHFIAHVYNSKNAKQQPNNPIQHKTTLSPPPQSFTHLGARFSLETYCIPANSPSGLELESKISGLLKTSQCTLKQCRVQKRHMCCRKKIDLIAIAFLPWPYRLYHCIVVVHFHSTAKLYSKSTSFFL